MFLWITWPSIQDCFLSGQHSRHKPFAFVNLFIKCYLKKPSSSYEWVQKLLTHGKGGLPFCWAFYWFGAAINVRFLSPTTQCCQSQQACIQTDKWWSAVLSSWCKTMAIMHYLNNTISFPIGEKPRANPQGGLKIMLIK